MRIRFLSLMVSVLLLSACATGTQIKDFSDRSVGYGWLDQIIMATGAADRPVNTSKLDGAEFQHSLEAPWGVPFMVKAPRRRTFLNGGVTYLDVMAQEKLWFPGGFYFDVPPGAAAVYIGTLRYHRNDFNTITRVEVIDERGDIATVLGPQGEVPDRRVVPSLCSGGFAERGRRAM